MPKLRVLRRPPVSRKKNALERAFIELVETLRPAFPDARVFERVRRLAFGMLTAEDRRTITSLLEATGRSDCDWSSDYRVFSRGVWEPSELFSRLLPSILELHPKDDKRVVASLDDTNIRKTGTHIPGVSYRRDPMSPPFQANLIRAQRFVQTSIAIPFGVGASAARAVPVAFDHAPSAGKLGKDATDEQKQSHREQQLLCSLPTYANEAIKQLRTSLDAAAAKEKQLLMAIDGSYTNGKVLTKLPERTDVIGRIRKDAVLHGLPVPDEQKGRPRLYGTKITPEQVRQDDAIPWRSVKIFGAGRVHDCDIKEVTPLLWRKTGSKLRLRLIIIRPLAYRRSKSSRLLYRQPAYLITTDHQSTIEELVQAYFWRWDIEVNHRDEKQIIGVGQAQVRSPKSAPRVPAFAVTCYSMLLISAAKTFGLAATAPVTDRPKWQRSSSQKRTRLSTRELKRRLQTECRDHPLHLPNYSHFARNVARSLKSPKSAVTLNSALQHALN